MQAKLERIADEIGKIGLICAILTFSASLINLIVTKAIAGEDLLTLDSLDRVLNFLVVAITIVVVAVPEGLPLAVTIAFAYSVGKMRKEQNLVRRLDASETMGGVDEVCTDKTGTLTENRMSVVALYCEGKQNLGMRQLSDRSKTLLMHSICLNSSA